MTHMLIDLLWVLLVVDFVVVDVVAEILAEMVVEVMVANYGLVSIVVNKNTASGSVPKHLQPTSHPML